MISNKRPGLVPLGALLTIMLTAGALTGGQAAVAAAHGTRASAAAGWSIQRTPAPNVPTASPDAISCPTAAWCMSVGSYTGSQGAQQPLAEVWTGTAWHPVQAVSAGGALGTSLQGVSCRSPKACVTVGYSVHFGAKRPFQFALRAFAERWDGSSWH